VLSVRRDLAAARRLFRRALREGTIPAEVTTDRAPAYPRVLDELIPSALHTIERYANNSVETDHGRLKARLRPMRGLNAAGSREFLPPGMRSSRTFAAATMSSPSTSRPATGSAKSSTSSRRPSDQLAVLVSTLWHARRSANATLPATVRPSLHMCKGFVSEGGLEPIAHPFALATEFAVGASR